MGFKFEDNIKRHWNQPRQYLPLVDVNNVYQSFGITENERNFITQFLGDPLKKKQNMNNMSVEDVLGLDEQQFVLPCQLIHQHTLFRMHTIPPIVNWRRIIAGFRCMRLLREGIGVTHRKLAGLDLFESLLEMPVVVIVEEVQHGCFR